MKKAVVVGIDKYPHPNTLSGCVNDAVEMAAMLETNGDGSPNFDVLRIISSEESVKTDKLYNAITNLFSGEAETAVLYFAGHCFLNGQTNDGFLVTQDGAMPNWGVSLSGILQLANQANPRIQSTVIILDSCQSGFIGEVSGMGSANTSVIGTGVTILTACHKEGVAEEAARHGKFTHILLDGLNGAASDILGRITPASLYAHVDQTLGAFEQRPIYKANVQNFISLRTVTPKVPVTILRKLPEYFPSASHIHKLCPACEPNRGEETERLKHIPVDNKKHAIYEDLQQCNRNGLVVPSEPDHKHMWESAVYSGGCRLTATGAHYRHLAEKKKL